MSNIKVGSKVRYFKKVVETETEIPLGSVWIVKEKGFKTKESVVLGVPFITEGLYNAPKQYQVNDVYQMVLSKLRKIVGEIK